jgi:hypothetical protein
MRDKRTAGVPNKTRDTARYTIPAVSATIQSTSLIGTRTHTPPSFPMPRNFLLSSYAQKRHMEYQYLAQPHPANPVEQPVRAPGEVHLLDADHVFVARALQPIHGHQGDGWCMH